MVGLILFFAGLAAAIVICCVYSDKAELARRPIPAVPVISASPGTTPTRHMFRPQKAPLFDSEIVHSGRWESIGFMIRPIGAKFAFADGVKHECDTSLTLPGGEIPEGHEYDIHALELRLVCGSAEEQAAFLKGSLVVEFFWRGVPSQKYNIPIASAVERADRSFNFSVKIKYRGDELSVEKNIKLAEEAEKIIEDMSSDIRKLTRTGRGYNITVGGRSLYYTPKDRMIAYLSWSEPFVVAAPVRIEFIVNGIWYRPMEEGK
jgi:hypothetical protein